MIKKKVLITFLFIFFIVMIHNASFATTKGVITGETVKLRDGASLESKLVMLLSVNDKVEVISQDGDWYQVNYKDKTGYVYKDYVKVEGEVEKEEPVTEEEKIEEQPEGQPEELPEQKPEISEDIETDSSEKITIEDVDIKAVPLIHAISVGQIKKDTKIEVKQNVNGWCYIQADLIEGWVRKEKLKVVETKPVVEPEKPKEEPVEKPKETPKTKIGYVNVDTVNVRSEQSTSSEVITNLSKNSKVTIESEENNWSKVTVNGRKGYIASKYLSSSPVEVTNRSGNGIRAEKEPEVTNSSKEEIKQENVNTNTSNTANNANSTKGSEIVAYAKQFLGNRYVSGGTTPKGFDCSGFTQYVYKHFGYSLNRTSAAQAKNGVQVEKANLQLGDLVFFTQGSSSIGHVGIYIGGNKFIHASNPSDGVKITSMSDSYYKARYVTSRRII